jgi:hypothetical protein
MNTPYIYVRHTRRCDMLFFVVVHSNAAQQPEFKIVEVDDKGLETAEADGWHMLYGGFHTRHDADECLYALTHPSVFGLCPM